MTPVQSEEKSASTENLPSIQFFNDPTSYAGVVSQANEFFGSSGAIDIIYVILMRMS
jgi:hypothetical protein